MEEPREVGLIVRKLSCQIRRYVDAHSPADACVTHMQGRVLGYLAHHVGTDVFQRDLEREFEIRRSTATAILQVMERDGLLTREPVDYDARLKKLVMTERAWQCCATFRQLLMQTEAQITRGVPPAELEQFYATMEAFLRNLAMDGGNEA